MLTAPGATGALGGEAAASAAPSVQTAGAVRTGIFVCPAQQRKWDSAIFWCVACKLLELKAQSGEWRRYRGNVWMAWNNMPWLGCSSSFAPSLKSNILRGVQVDYQTLFIV